jgi:transglutaminase-like putative cysteine protease
MFIRLGYDLQFDIPAPVAMIALLNVHPSRRADLREPDVLQTNAQVPIEIYEDVFGNSCARFLAPAGLLHMSNSTLIEDSGEPDPVDFTAEQLPVEKLPTDVIGFLLSSRYCQVDQLLNTAGELFTATPPGWARVQAICDWVNHSVTFGYNFARSTKTALDVYTERTGVCRDFQHLCITFCRAMNIPARYVAGYLGDIGVPAMASPGDFSAWFEVYLGDRWWAFDGRFNQRRIGRIPIARGRDATDTAITTTFGNAVLKSFVVVTEEAATGPALVTSAD